MCVSLLFFYQDVSSKPAASTGFNRVAPLDDDLVDPWADARKNLASSNADVSSERQGVVVGVCLVYVVW